MGKVKYTGPDDARILDASDIAKAVEDADFRKTTFNKGEVVELDDAVIEAITAVPEIFGNFEAVSDEEPETKSKSKSKADEGAVTKTASASTSDAPASRPSGKASTGA